MAICFEKYCIVSLCNKFGNGLAGLNHVVFCNPDFIWVKSADKTVQMPQTWFSELTQTIWLKKTAWVGTQQLICHLLKYIDFNLQ